jgi:hypothetical protein
MLMMITKLLLSPSTTAKVWVLADSVCKQNPTTRVTTIAVLPVSAISSAEEAASQIVIKVQRRGVDPEIMIAGDRIGMQTMTHSTLIQSNQSRDVANNNSNFNLVSSR